MSKEGGGGVEHKQEASAPRRGFEEGRESGTTTATSASRIAPPHKASAHTQPTEGASSETAAKAVASQPYTSEEIQEVEPSAGHGPRQVIAVSASKGPAAFFNLARKFLVTDEVCDLSALEGAIVSAVDAAHLLERSKLATIMRIQTSYVAVEPKRKKVGSGPQHGADVGEASIGASELGVSQEVFQPPHQQMSLGAEWHQPQHMMLPTGQLAPQYPLPQTDPPIEALSRTRRTHHSRTRGSPLRRARIIITVKRTEAYKNWLDENPLQAMDEDAEPEESIRRQQEARKGS